MNVFKVGDKVKATTNYPDNSCQNRVLVGDVGEVVDKDGAILTVKINGYCEKMFSYRFVKFEPEFDVKNVSWFIKVNNEAEFNIVKSWLSEKYDHYNVVKYSNKVNYLTNTDGDGDVCGHIMRGTELTHYHTNEIKFEFETVIKTVEYPTVKSKTQIAFDNLQEKITELQKQADLLKSEL